LNLDPAAAPPASLAASFRRMREAFHAGGGLEYAGRMRILASLAALLRDETQALCAAMDQDFRGRASQETRLLEIVPALSAIAHARRHLRAWMRPQRRPTGRWFHPGRSRVVCQPLGVAGIVVPWNYPLYLALGPATSAIAAGNRVLVKMPEGTPATSRLLQRLVAERVPADALALVNGGPQLAREFVALPFDHLLFTGSTTIGREVMRAAAANLTPVTLELGGKSPAIVGRGIDVAEAAERILFGKCLNAGQTCIAPDYALVPEERLEAFVQAAIGAVARLYPSLASNADYSAIIDARHRARLAAYVDEARAAGTRVVEINPAGEDFASSAKMAPTLLVAPGEGLAAMREEIFGPVLPIVPYRALGDAIAFVNARPRPLALYVFDHDRRAVDEVLRRTVSGGATVNETLLHVAQDELPFGGVGPSGMGEYHGRAGFETFSKRKSVFYASRWSALRLLRPPYGARFEAIARVLLRLG